MVVAATPQESGTQSLSIVATVVLSLHPIWDHIPPLLASFQTPLQLPHFLYKLLQLALIDYAITESYPLNQLLRQQGHQRHATIRARPALESPTVGAGPVIPTTTTVTSPTTATHSTFPPCTSNTSASHTPPHHTTSDSGPYRDKDVFLSLQLSEQIPSCVAGIL